MSSPGHVFCAGRSSLVEFQGSRSWTDTHRLPPRPSRSISSHQAGEPNRGLATLGSGCETAASIGSADLECVALPQTSVCCTSRREQGERASEPALGNSKNRKQAFTFSRTMLVGPAPNQLQP